MKSKNYQTVSPIIAVLTLALTVTGSVGFLYIVAGFGDDCNNGAWFLHGEKYHGQILNVTWSESNRYSGDGWLYSIGFEDEELLRFIQGGYVSTNRTTVGFKDDCKDNLENPLEIGQKVVFNGAELPANEFFILNRYNVMKMEVEQ